jgi:uncharacterized membrane protein
MITKDAYKLKIESEVELVQAKLSEFKARAKITTADARIKYAQQVEALEQKVDDTKAKLKELGNASDDAWVQFKGGVEQAWDGFSTAVSDLAAKFKD